MIHFNVLKDSIYTKNKIIYLKYIISTFLVYDYTNYNL